MIVEKTGSAALEAIRTHNTISDDRFKVAQSLIPSALLGLAEKGMACSFIALEADKHFYKGKRPCRARSRFVYDKSGPNGSPESLEVLSKDQHKNLSLENPGGDKGGILGQTYAVKIWS